MTYIQINNWSILLVLYGPTQAPPFLKTSANTSQLVNSELSDKFDLRYHYYDQRGVFIWSPLANMVNRTPFEGTIIPYFPTTTQRHRKKKVEITCRKVSFLSSSPLRLSNPCLCCVTDDFNYLLTPCTQQIHMINGPGDCCTHHLDGAKESKQLSSTVILKTATTAGGGLQVYRGRTRNCPSLDPVDSYLVSKGSHPFFLSETAGSNNMPREKAAYKPQWGERLLEMIGQQIAALYMEIVVKEMEAGM